MDFCVVKEMFPSERTLTNEEVDTLYENACKVVKYNMYCCYRLVDIDLNQQKFIHIHDNDGSKTDICTGPFIIKWIAVINEKAKTVSFLPYLSYTVVSYSFDERLDEYLHRCLDTLDIRPVELSDKWSGYMQHNEVVLRRYLTAK